MPIQPVSFQIAAIGQAPIEKAASLAFRTNNAQQPWPAIADSNLVGRGSIVMMACTPYSGQATVDISRKRSAPCQSYQAILHRMQHHMGSNLNAGIPRKADCTSATTECQLQWYLAIQVWLWIWVCSIPEMHSGRVITFCPCLVLAFLLPLLLPLQSIQC